MRSSILRDARKKLEDVRKGMIREITEALPAASDQQLTKVAEVLWPAPKSKGTSKGTSGKKAKPKRPKRPIKLALNRKNAAAGRRAVATGERPAMRNAMVLVMGKKTMNAQGVVDALAKKKWLPASSDHRQYVSFMLSDNCPETFTRTAKRGHYRVTRRVLQRVQKEEAERQAAYQAQELRDHWGISSPATKTETAPPASPQKTPITASNVRAFIKQEGLVTVDLPDLALKMGCKVEQLCSPVSKLVQDSFLLRTLNGKKRSYRVADSEPTVPV